MPVNKSVSSTTPRSYDEQEAFDRLEHARERKDAAAVRAVRNEIMLANGGLIRNLARKACRYYAYLGFSTFVEDPSKNVPTLSEDDFVQHGYILMSKAIETFTRAKGNRFSTYATSVIGHGLNQVYNTRALKKYTSRHFVSLDKTVGEDEATLGDFLADDQAAPVSDALERQDLGRALAAAFAMLGERERQILAMSQGYGCEKRKLVDIAEIFHVSPQRITQIVGESLRKLRTHPALRELRRAG